MSRDGQGDRQRDGLPSKNKSLKARQKSLKITSSDCRFTVIIGQDKDGLYIRTRWPGKLLGPHKSRHIRDVKFPSPEMRKKFRDKIANHPTLDLGDLT